MQDAAVLAAVKALGEARAAVEANRADAEAKAGDAVVNAYKVFKFTREPALLLEASDVCVRQRGNTCRTTARDHLLEVLASRDLLPGQVVGVAVALKRLTAAPDDLEKLAEKMYDEERASAVAKILADVNVAAPGGDEAAIALSAARLYMGLADSVWAAQLFRRCLTLQPAGPLAVAARNGLGQLRLPETPPYPNNASVSRDYLNSRGTTSLYEEESKPQVNVLGMIFDWVGTKFWRGYDSVRPIKEADLQEFRNSFGPVLGNGVTDHRRLLNEAYVAFAVERRNQVPLVFVDFCMKGQYLSFGPNLPPPLLVRNGQFMGYPMVEEVRALNVGYLKSDAERADYLVDLRAQGGPTRGAPIRSAGGVFYRPLFDTTALSSYPTGKGWAIYVMTPDGAFYSGSHSVSRFHHSSFLAAADVAAAGEIQARNGVVTGINNKSGHYLTTVPQLVQALQSLKAANVALERVVLDLYAISQADDKPVKVRWEDKDNARSFLAAWEGDKPKIRAWYASKRLKLPEVLASGNR
ncbi:MAG: hypothetical protein U0835_00975 [Isosphaeraceae bacterium]